MKYKIFAFMQSLEESIKLYLKLGETKETHHTLMLYIMLDDIWLEAIKI